MTFDIRPSPVRVSKAAAAPFPRLALWAVLVVFIGTGLVGRDPWYQEDAAGFGIMWTMAHGAPADWLLPNVVGEFVAEGGPLAYWIGAVFIRVFGGWFGDAAAARLTTVLWFMIGTASVWYATYRLARRDEAQPVAFVFGGEARPRDYGRMLADIALLLYVATLGPVLRVHETTDLAAAVALMAVVVFGLALALERVWPGVVLTGIAVGLLGLAHGLPTALFSVAGAAAALLLTLPRTVRVPAVVVLFVLALMVSCAWPLAALLAPADARAEYFAAWSAWARASFGLPTAIDVAWLTRTLAWYLWPLWPFAVWALFAWRHGLGRAHVALPALLSLALLLFALVAPQSEPPLLLLAVPLAVLAAFGAISLRPAAESAIDWFAIVTFSFFMLVGWAYFVAMLTGTPPKMAASVARLTPGYTYEVDLLAIAVAVLATLIWVALVVWRVARRPEMLWRGPLLAAAGLTTLWFLANTLFLPAVNYKRSYRPIALEIRHEIERAAGPRACVLAYQLRPAHRAMLAYLGGIRFGTARDACPLVLQRDLRKTHLDDAPPAGDWRTVWEGRWPARPDETFRLLARAPA